MRRGNHWQGVSIPRKTTNKKGKYMKKLLLIALVASGFAFASAPRSDAGVAVGIGSIALTRTGPLVQHKFRQRQIAWVSDFEIKFVVRHEENFVTEPLNGRNFIRRQNSFGNGAICFFD